MEGWGNGREWDGMGKMGSGGVRKRRGRRGEFCPPTFIPPVIEKLVW